MGTQHVQIDEAAAMVGATADKLMLAAVEGTLTLWALICDEVHAEDGYYEYPMPGEGDPFWAPTSDGERRFLTFAPLSVANAGQILRDGDTVLRNFTAPHETPFIEGEMTQWHFHPVVTITRSEVFLRRDDIPHVSELFGIKRAADHGAAPLAAASPPTGAPTIRESSLLAVIAALMAQWPGGKVPSAKELETAAQTVGVSVSDDTIRKALAQAREIAPGLPPPK